VTLDPPGDWPPSEVDRHNGFQVYHFGIYHDASHLWAMHEGLVGAGSSTPFCVTTWGPEIIFAPRAYPNEPPTVLRYNRDRYVCYAD